MTKRVEQRYCIKFCQKLGDTRVETIRKIQAVLLAVPQAENNFKRKEISIKGRHYEKIDGGAWKHSGGGF